MAIAVPIVHVPLWLVSPSLISTSSVTFILLVITVGLWTHHHGPIPYAHWVIRWNSRLYSFASALMLLLTMQYALQDHNLHDGKAAEGPARGKLYTPLRRPENTINAAAEIALAPLAYHLSKLYEYTDILLVLANHGPNYRSLSQQPIDLHFAFHHLTTPYLTLFRIIRSSDPGWELFALLNCMHHVLMYAFFGGGARWAGLKPEMLRRVLPWTGALQLVAGIAMEVWSLRSVHGQLDGQEYKRNLQGNWVALGLLCAYLVLYTRDLRMRAKESASSAEK